MDFFSPPSVVAAGRHASHESTPLQRRKWDVPPGVIGASIAETDFGTAPAVSKALHRAIEEGFLTYLPEGLAREAEHACADFLRHRFGWDVDKDRVRLVSDVMAGFALVAELFTQPDSKIIVPTPCYMPFLTEPLRIGREVIEVPMNRANGRWSIDLVALDQAFRDGGELLVLCNPHNPVGQVMTIDEQREVAAVVERHSGRVFEDAIHAPIVYPGAEYVPYAKLSPQTAAHTVTAVATSKGWNIPGLKAAQLILSGDADLELWTQRDPVPSLRGSILGALAAIAAYRESVDWLDSLTARLAENRDYFTNELTTAIADIDFVRPQATYLGWVGVANTSIEDPTTHIQTHGNVLVTAGSGCGKGFESFIRFNFALQPHILEDATQRLVRALNGADTRTVTN